MCDVSVVQEKHDELEDYLEHVNTNLVSLMRYDSSVYAGYAAHNNLSIYQVKEWYEDAEDAMVSSGSPDLYLMKKYDIWTEDAIDSAYEKEVHQDCSLYECFGYFYRTL